MTHNQAQHPRQPERLAALTRPAARRFRLLDRAATLIGQVLEIIRRFAAHPWGRNWALRIGSPGRGVWVLRWFVWRNNWHGSCGVGRLGLACRLPSPITPWSVRGHVLF